MNFIIVAQNLPGWYELGRSNFNSWLELQLCENKYENIFPAELKISTRNYFKLNFRMKNSVIKYFNKSGYWNSYLFALSKNLFYQFDPW